MTEKTTKTPHPDQNSGVSKDQTPVSGSKGQDKPSDVSSAQAATKGSGTPAGQKASTPAQPAAGGLPANKEAAEKARSSTGKTGAVPATAGGGAGGSSTPPPKTSGVPPKKPSSVPIIVIALVVIFLAAGLAYQYSTSQQQMARLESQSRSSADQARQAEQKAQQALDALNQQRNMFGALQAELRESRAELDGLNSAFQTITDRGSDLVLLNDIDHLVMIAQQQLQLNGNVANAIISLETAQAQLARANRPALASLQQTINGDLDRLRAATTVDIALLSARLDELAGLVSQAPLLIPDDVVPVRERTARDSADGQPSARATSGSDSDPWWEKALKKTQEWTSNTFNSMRQDLGQFVSVRRVDDASALLISPDQATRFRDSLRQRIMTAQLALMMDQSLIWETETDALLQAIESRFDTESSVTRQAIRVAREVADTAIDTPMPDVSNSIQALEAINEQMGRRAVSEYPAADVQPSDEGNGQATPDVQAESEEQADVESRDEAEAEVEAAAPGNEHLAPADDDAEKLAPEALSDEAQAASDDIADDVEANTSADEAEVEQG